MSSIKSRSFRLNDTGEISPVGHPQLPRFRRSDELPRPDTHRYHTGGEGYPYGRRMQARARNNGGDGGGIPAHCPENGHQEDAEARPPGVPR